LKALVHRVLDFLPCTSSVKFNGVILPPSRRRWCGPEFRNNEYYLNSAVEEAKRLKLEFGIKNNNNILDIGCGYGRLPIGLHQVFDSINYLGIDVFKPSIRWCRKFITKNPSKMEFIHLDMKNERYNNIGEKISNNFRFPLQDKSQDLIYLYSVFSHMELEDTRQYLKEFKRIIKTEGKIFFTAFIEKNVTDYKINPENYIFEKFTGPLHVVRYDYNFIKNELEIAGFAIEKIFQSTETDKQSGLLIKSLNNEK